MKKILLGILIFSLLIPGLPGFGATNEGYGEDSEALGQFVDSFEDMDNISVAVDVIRNSTLEVMELNYTLTSGGVYEDFTTFTEDDIANDLTQTQFTANWTTMRRDSDSHAWKDYGANYFDDFSFEFTFIPIDIEAGDFSGVAIMHLIALANSNTGISGIWGDSTAIGVELQQNLATDDQWKYRLYQLGETNAYGSTNWALDTHYITLNRTGNDIGLFIFDDSLRTNLIDSIEIVGNSLDYRYIEVTIGYDAVGDGADHSTGSIEYLDIGSTGSGYETDGYFSTVDYLSDPLTNGSALVALINTTIPVDTQILVEFSEDNITWVFNDWQPLFGGFEAVDLRELNYSTGFYSRFNLSTADNLITPRVYQNRLITTMGNHTAITINQTINLLNGTWVEYNLTAIDTEVGVHDSGNLASTYFIDGDTYNCSEVVGAPGYRVSFNVSNVNSSASCLWIAAYVYYDGNLAHDIHIELYNHTSGAWVEIDVIDDDVAFEWHNSSIYELRMPSDFINATGSVFGRLDHVSAGNINHDIYIEYLRIHAFVPTGLAVAVGGAGVNRPTILIVGGLITVCMAVFIGVKKR